MYEVKICYNIIMRQRNVKNKQEIINNSNYVILFPKNLKGKWHEVFQNNHPIYVEIGMGKGDFLFSNALKYPNINFIGIEKYDSIMALAIKKIDKEYSNLKLIRMDAKDINEVFDYEIEKIFLNFSDPWPKPRHSKRRLTSPNFLTKYDSLFCDKKVIEQKTDNRDLFLYSLISYNECDYKIKEISLDLHHDCDDDIIMTEYEKKFSKMGQNIYYVKVEKSSKV